MKSLPEIRRANLAPPRKRIKPAKPTPNQRLIAFGHLTETAERCEEMAARIRSLGVGPDNDHLATFTTQARALRAVAEWIRPEAS